MLWEKIVSNQWDNCLWRHNVKAARRMIRLDYMQTDRGINSNFLKNLEGWFETILKAINASSRPRKQFSVGETYSRDVSSMLEPGLSRIQTSQECAVLGIFLCSFPHHGYKRAPSRSGADLSWYSVRHECSYHFCILNSNLSILRASLVVNFVSLCPVKLIKSEWKILRNKMLWNGSMTFRFNWDITFFQKWRLQFLFEKMKYLDDSLWRLFPELEKILCSIFSNYQGQLLFLLEANNQKAFTSCLGPVHHKHPWDLCIPSIANSLSRVMLSSLLKWPAWYVISHQNET